ncbi:MAG: ATP-binding cassette domain-containing protein [Candidatus Thorarchaeota archaeon]
MALIEFVDFSFRYVGSDSFALRHIDLRIEQGEFVVLTGPSGCGKTTLCRAMNGLVPHFHRGYVGGMVLVDGLDTRNHSVAQLASKVGIVFQNPANQLVTLNVEKEIAFGPENLGVEPIEIRRRVDELISLLGLERLRGKHPHEMSGGEQQSVAIASVLALRPKILVADEPTSHLDPHSSEMVLDMIKRLNEQGMTVVLTEHRLDLVAGCASRVILMNEGQIVADGPPREVLCKDLCLELGIGVPKAMLVYRFLTEHGVRLPRAPLNSRELVSIMQEMLGHDSA